MSIPPNSKLIQFISTNHAEYYGKICELREVVEGWLSYIPATFPHYTRHTIDHSDEIVLQVSNLLFRDDDMNPIVNLSGVEAYIIVAAAYLHDAGMVTPDKEKTEILISDEWKTWTSGENGGAKRWNEIQSLRASASDAAAGVNSPTVDFLADVQTRFLIADFIRSRHHLRSGQLIEVQHEQLGRCDFGDPILRRSVAAVCVGHGLRTHELEDTERFPETSDVRGEKANLRFLATLLRLGDLLDMRTLRACPLLIGAASPLPVDSLDHWIQYDAITHRSTTPERIEITAECLNQDVHRILQDWCQWIVEEANNARNAMVKSRRHSNWQIPEVTLATDSPTIKIRPKQGATYKPSKWIMQFDQQAIVERLSENLYSDAFQFVRELIQNSLDALRCKMYLDLERDGEPIPEFPTQVPQAVRERYGLTLEAQERTATNPLSGESEKKHVLIIEDNGIGMDREIIEKYFLQIGRSFYTSDEFKRTYNFFPTSRFGIGFLSVFAASSHVVVETFKPSSTLADNAPIRLTLTGVKSYLLHESSDRALPGTRIEVTLQTPIEADTLSASVKKWCKRVEFPIHINDFGETETVSSETPEMFSHKQNSVVDDEQEFCWRPFPIEDKGVEGELYIFEIRKANEAVWGEHSWASYRYPEMHPLAKAPRDPLSLIALHGISVNEEVRDRPSSDYRFRIDFRNNETQPNLNRSFLKWVSHEGVPEVISVALSKGLDEHLATSEVANGEDGWKYKQTLMSAFDIPGYWDLQPDTFPLIVQNVTRTVSIRDIWDLEEFDVIVADPRLVDIRTGGREVPYLHSGDLSYAAYRFVRSLFKDHSPRQLCRLADGNFAVNFTRLEKGQVKSITGGYWVLRVCEFENISSFSFFGRSLGRHGDDLICLNEGHPFYQWMELFREVCTNGEFGLSEERWDVFCELVYQCTDPDATDSYTFAKLQSFLTYFQTSTTIPVSIRPPDLSIDRETFFVSPASETQDDLDEW